MTNLQEKDEKRLVRNEKARRRNALKAVLKPLPEEIEDMIMSHLKNPSYYRHGRPVLDVSMRWQRHPNAKLIVDLNNKLAEIRCEGLRWLSHWEGGVTHWNWGGQNHFYHYLSYIIDEFLRYRHLRDLNNLIMEMSGYMNIKSKRFRRLRKRLFSEYPYTLPEY
tara:strand:- start:833 stop:1324 length:492 start_codon:yes stop_codon:yes gene_type:complete